MDSNSKLIILSSIVLGVALGFVAYNNTTNDEGSLDLFEVPLVYANGYVQGVLSIPNDCWDSGKTWVVKNAGSLEGSCQGAIIIPIDNFGTGTNYANVCPVFIPEIGLCEGAGGSPDLFHSTGLATCDNGQLSFLEEDCPIIPDENILEKIINFIKKLLGYSILPVAYGHFADDYPFECGLIPSLEQCNKTITHEIRDWIFDLLVKFLGDIIGDQLNPIK